MASGITWGEQNFISLVKIGDNTYYLKDLELRDSLRGLLGSMRWIGVTESTVDEGEHNTASVVIGSTTYSANGTAGSTTNKEQLEAGDVVGFGAKEFIWNGSAWQEFGDMGDLSALVGQLGNFAYADSGSVSLNGGATSKLVTTSITGTDGTETVSKVTKSGKKLAITSITPTNGTESVSSISDVVSKKLSTTSITPINGSTTASSVTKTSKSLATTSITPVSGTETVSAISNVTTKKLSTTTITGVSGSENNIAQITPAVSNETLEFTLVSLPKAAVSATTVATGGVESGDQFIASFTNTDKTVAKAGDSINVATGKLAASDTNGDSLIEDVTISSVSVPVAGTAVTVATGGVETGDQFIASFTNTSKTVAKVGSAVTVATGSLTTTGEGADIIEDVTISDKTVAKVASSSTIVATGQVATNGAGATVATALPTGGTATPVAKS